MKTFAVPAALLLGVFSLTACGPKKEPATPAKPNVSSSSADAPSAAHTVAAASAAVPALPVLGKAPSWQLKDLNGATVSSDQFRGKVVVLDFWATWCGPCRSEMPGYTDLQRKYGKDGLVIIGVSVDEGGPAVVKSFVDKYGVGYKIVMSDDNIQSAFGGFDAIPTTFLIDRDGNVRDRKLGALPTEEYEKRILAVLGKAS